MKAHPAIIQYDLIKELNADVPEMDRSRHGLRHAIRHVIFGSFVYNQHVDGMKQDGCTPFLARCSRLSPL
ncbi:hypothetical protein [Paenibacillus koleovorans]|uniref:hypothetical protein n=1 Tax=Paenibacillus koleovorans TaxID=121608 RepID=UPI000FD7777C|nr:hypothetical protein [Paenibacillus koleovorans]